MPHRGGSAKDPTLRRQGPSSPVPQAESGSPQGVPESIGAYPILRELGRGGMGVVYLARDRRLDREVALKMLPPELDSDAEARERFIGEARALAALNHPNIATIHSLEDSAGRHFLTMELVEGRSLWERLSDGRLGLDETLSVMRQLARAVEAAHSKGVVHRDLKPSNLMIQDDGQVKVLDFGLAVRLKLGATGASEAAAGGGTATGTPGYMSPEQLLGEPADPRADVWAVGCMLYECLAGRPLIRGDRVDKIAATAALDIGATLDAEGPDFTPPRLAQLLRRCLATRAAERLASIREVRLLIEEEIAERALPHAAGETQAAPEPPLVPGNLPRRLTSFIGRSHDLEAVAKLLGEHRLVTITGAGGCGKTRLSVELARRMSGASPDGVWLVELASLADPAMVPASVAAALAVSQTPATSMPDALIQSIGEKRVMVVLDNCEHLVDACAALAERVLAGCPRVRILATSREALCVEGEAVHPLAPLGVAGAGPARLAATHGDATRPVTPGTSGSAGAGTGTGTGSGRSLGGEDPDAVLLFVDRARAVLPGFTIDATNRGAIHEICRRLDGIPLAIELAAARVKALPVESIRDLLDDRFHLLSRGSRSAPPHQSTLKALIDWSYDRLDAREQAVLRRLSVFRGAWALDAVEAVVAGGEVEAHDVLDLFTRLVEKSLVVRDVLAQGSGSSRYYLFETVRVYAREKLGEHGDEEQRALGRHREHVVALAVAGEDGLRGPDQARWSARLSDAVDDVRSVLEFYAQDPDGAEGGLRVVGSCWLHWYRRGMLQEGSERIERALAHPAADHASASFGRALVAGGNLAFRMGQLDRSEKFYREALSVLLRVGTGVQVGSVYLNLGNIAYSRGEYDQAERMFETSLDHYRRADAPLWVAGCLTNLSALALAREDIDRLETLESEALQIHEAAGIRDGMCLDLLQLGSAAFVRGDHDLARARWGRALELARQIDHGWIIIASLENLAFLELSLGRLEDARDRLAECMSLLLDMPDPILALPVLEGVAGVAAGTRAKESGAILFAAATLRQTLRMPLLPYERRCWLDLESRLTAALGEEEMERARAAGRGMTLDGALSLARALLEAPVVAAGPREAWPTVALPPPAGSR